MQTLSLVYSNKIPHFPFFSYMKSSIICVMFFVRLCVSVMLPHFVADNNSCVRYALLKCIVHRMEFPRRMRLT